jgi:hypothetical protein
MGIEASQDSLGIFRRHTIAIGTFHPLVYDPPGLACAVSVGHRPDDKSRNNKRMDEGTLEGSIGVPWHLNWSQLHPTYPVFRGTSKDRTRDLTRGDRSV